MGYMTTSDFDFALLQEGIGEYIESNKDKRMKDYVLFIGYEEIGVEDETLIVGGISNIDSIYPLIKRAKECYFDDNAISINTKSQNLNMFVNQEFFNQLHSYVQEKLDKVIKLKMLTFISALVDQSKHSFQKLTNLIYIRSTIDKKEDFLYFFERLLEQEGN